MALNFKNITKIEGMNMKTQIQTRLKLSGKVLRLEKAHRRAMFREAVCFILCCSVFIALGVMLAIGLTGGI